MKTSKGLSQIIQMSSLWHLQTISITHALSRCQTISGGRGVIILFISIIFYLDNLLTLFIYILAYFRHSYQRQNAGQDHRRYEYRYRSRSPRRERSSRRDRSRSRSRRRRHRSRS